MKRVALYLRVSTKEQSVENQRLELERVSTSKGWTIVATYEDEGISGAKGRDKRPAYDRLLKDAVRSKFNVVMAWDVSRLGRSLNGLVQALDDLHANGVDLYLHQQALDTTTPSGKALFQMCGVFAEFERSMTVERVRAGLSRARDQGTVLGRPRSKVDMAKVRAERQLGASYRQIAKNNGISVGAAYSIVKSNKTN